MSSTNPIYHVFKNAASSLMKHLILLIAGGVILGAVGSYAAIKSYRSNQAPSPEYHYQDQSGTRVVLNSSQCEYSPQALDQLRDKFGKTREQVKALTLHGDGWKKEGCWIKLDTTNEVAVSTEPGKIDTVLDLDQFTPAGAAKTETPKVATGGLKSFFSEGLNPSKQDTFAYAPFDQNTQSETLVSFWHDMACGQVWRDLPAKLQKAGLDPYTFKAGKFEFGTRKDGQWNVLQTMAVCYRDEPHNKRLLVLVRNQMVPFSYAELSTEPFKVTVTN